ncbi:MAG: LamG domain-containing protein [Rickettsiales bacterium]|jgi:hypothetical protein|nr:LamG domain-containing protein [Rickettsiales bacterium]
MSMVENLIIAAIIPLSGIESGGNILTVTGSNFPYHSINSYVSDGLVAHYDGIDNQGLGDENHSTDTLVWKDLSGNNNNVTFSGALGNAKWTAKGFKLGDNRFFQNTALNMIGLPFGNESYTIELVWDPRQSKNLGDGGLLGWGCNGAGSQTNNTRFLNATLTNQCFRHYWWSNDFDFCVPTSDNPVRNIAITYDNTVGRRGYFNGVLFGTNSNKNKNTCTSGGFYIGKTTNNEYATGTLVFSIRIYNRQLTDAEIAQNHAIDSARFQNLPVVKIGENLCDDLKLLSDTKMTCIVPAGSGTNDITMGYGGDENVIIGAYKYIIKNLWHSVYSIRKIFIQGKSVKNMFISGRKIF